MSTKQSSSLLSREYIFLTCINFFMSMNFFALSATTPDYIINHFNQSESVAGVAVAFFLVGLLSSRFVAGSLVNILGFRRLQTIAIVSFVLASSGYFFASTTFAFFIVRFFAGFTYGLSSNTNITIVTSIIPRERSGEGVGYYMMMQTLAMAIGPFVALNLVADGGYNYVFALGTFLPAIGLIFLPFERLQNLTLAIKNEAAEAEAEKATKGLDKFFERRIFPVAIITLAVAVLHSSVMPFMSVYAKEIDLSTAARYYFVVNAITILATRPLVSKLFDKKGAAVILIPGISLIAIGFFSLSTTETVSALLISAALFGAGSGAVMTATPALAVKLSPRYRLGVANATCFMALDSSAAMGPVISGLIIPFSGFRGFYMIAFVWTLICIPLCWFIYTKKIKANIKA